MASTLNDTRVVSTPAAVDRTEGAEALVEQTEASEGLRIARFCSLEEFLGLVFGVMTVCWIVGSMAKLVL